MKCPNCDTLNPDNAKFCKTCGINLQESHIFEENIAEEKTHTPTVESNANYQQTNTNSGNNSGSSDWLMCCVCLIAIFIVFAIISSF